MSNTHQKNDIIEINFILFFRFSSVCRYHTHHSICVNKINLENWIFFRFFSGILRITSYLNGRIQKKVSNVEDVVVQNRPKSIHCCWFRLFFVGQAKGFSSMKTFWTSFKDSMSTNTINTIDNNRENKKTMSPIFCR